MEFELILLVCAGAIGGFVGGLVGVGGGLIFAPIFFFYFQNLGVPSEALTPLTIGSSLSCTMVVAISSARSHMKKNAVDRKIALVVGSTSAIAAILMTFYVTTQVWYNPAVFKVVFAVLLLIVAIRMFFQGKGAHHGSDEPDAGQVAGSAPHTSWSFLLTGSAAGIVSTAAGVGGGIVMVPLYNKLFRMSMIRSVGTSSATIVLVSLFGMISYMATGWGQELTTYSLGYVDLGRAVLISIPAAVTARLGVSAAHRFNKITLQRSFAVVAIVVAVRLLASVFGVA